jgi:hypothetical protein
MAILIEIFVGTSAYHAERCRRRAYARYCRERFGKRSRAYHRALLSLRTL